VSIVSKFNICRGIGLVVFCPFTRLWAVEPFFAALAASDVPLEDAIFVGYVDSDSTILLEAVEQAALDLPFAGVMTYFSNWMPPAETKNSASRRIRHGIMRETSKTLVGDGEVLLLEDDTLIPPDTFAHLSESRQDGDWVIGSEVGRWGKRPVGVWKVTEKKGKPYRLDSMMPKKGVESADATGLYCVLTDAAIYKSIDFGTWNNAMGHDVYVTWLLKKAGKKLLVDWRVPCIHITMNGSITIDDAAEYSRKLDSLDTETLATIVDMHNPAEMAPVVKSISYPVTLGVTVNLDGRMYPKGTRVDRKTALKMKTAGLLKDPRIV